MSAAKWPISAGLRAAAAPLQGGIFKQWDLPSSYGDTTVGQETVRKADSIQILLMRPSRAFKWSICQIICNI